MDEAVQVLEHETISAVILDVRMPGRSGLELLAFIRAKETLRNLPVLILTGVILTPDEEAIIARCRAYVFYKPDNLEALGAYLDQLTRR